jgi:hypothetical protein
MLGPKGRSQTRHLIAVLDLTAAVAVDRKAAVNAIQIPSMGRPLP